MKRRFIPKLGHYGGLGQPIYPTMTHNRVEYEVNPSYSNEGYLTVADRGHLPYPTGEITTIPIPKLNLSNTEQAQKLGEDALFEEMRQRRIQQLPEGYRPPVSDREGFSQITYRDPYRDPSAFQDETIRPGLTKDELSAIHPQAKLPSPPEHPRYKAMPPSFPSPHEIKPMPVSAIGGKCLPGTVQVKPGWCRVVNAELYKAAISGIHEKRREKKMVQKRNTMFPDIPLGAFGRVRGRLIRRAMPGVFDSLPAPFQQGIIRTMGAPAHVPERLNPGLVVAPVAHPQGAIQRRPAGVMPYLSPQVRAMLMKR